MDSKVLYSTLISDNTILQTHLPHLVQYIKKNSQDIRIPEIVQRIAQIGDYYNTKGSYSKKYMSELGALLDTILSNKDTTFDYFGKFYILVIISESLLTNKNKPLPFNTFVIDLGEYIPSKATEASQLKSQLDYIRNNWDLSTNNLYDNIICKKDPFLWKLNETSYLGVGAYDRMMGSKNAYIIMKDTPLFQKAEMYYSSKQDMKHIFYDIRCDVTMGIKNNTTKLYKLITEMSEIEKQSLKDSLILYGTLYSKYIY